MEPSAEVDAATVERRRQRGRRIVLAAFLSVATVFIVSSTVQITRDVFGASLADPRSAALSPLPPACKEGIARLDAALDRAFPRAAASLVAAPNGDPAGEDAVARTFDEALLPEWGDEARVRDACAGGGAAEDALAAVLRLKMAEQSSLRRQAAELGPLRKRVGAHLMR